LFIIDGGPALLAEMSAQSHKDAYKALSKLGVKIILNTTVTDYYNDKVVLSTGDIIETKSLIWAAGVIAKTFEGVPPASIGRGRRMITDQYTKVQGLDDVYAIGDISIQKTDAAFPNGHPQLAQPAIQQGSTLAENLIALANGKPMKAFKYVDKGTMAIIGSRKAVCDLFTSKFHVSGFPALLIWLFIHLVQLINYRNKLGALLNWSIAYFTRDPSLRMIIRPETTASPERAVLKQE